MKISFIGYGNVGLPLASHLENLGHDVTLPREALQKASKKPWR